MKKTFVPFILTSALAFAQIAPSATSQVRVLPGHRHVARYWLTPKPGQRIAGAEVKAIYVIAADRQHPGAVLYAQETWIGIRPGADTEEKEFATETAARQWVEGGK